MSARRIAAVFGVSVSCVCRALDREQLMTSAQATRGRRMRWRPELYADVLPAANVSVSGTARR